MGINYINQSIYSIDYIFTKYGLNDFLTVNGYPLLTVVWNIALLAVPFGAAKLLEKYYRKTGFKKIENKILAGVMIFIWFIFMPNAAYIISDSRHISNFCFNNSLYRVCPENAWLIIFFFFYATIGLVAYIYLLNQMRNFLTGLWNGRKAMIFIFFSIPLISLGLLLGLLNRWNSWEIFINPIKILKSAGHYFSDPIYFKNWLIFTVFLFALYAGGNVAVKKIYKLGVDAH
jgi:uncharacterized membrane protein